MSRSLRASWPFVTGRERYRAAMTPAARAALEEEGVALAPMRAVRSCTILIVQNPQRALAVTVPAVVRQVLPAAVLAGIGNARRRQGRLRVDRAAAGSGSHRAASIHAPRRVHRWCYLHGPSLWAAGSGQFTRNSISLHGVALDGDLALHESPLRVLEPGKSPRPPAAPRCPVSNLPVQALTLSEPASTREAPNVVEADDHVYEFCGHDGPHAGVLRGAADCDRGRFPIRPQPRERSDPALHEARLNCPRRGRRNWHQKSTGDSRGFF